MALAIGMYKGDGVKIGNCSYKVTAIHGPEEFKIVRCGPTGEALSEELIIGAEKAQELNQEAFMSAGIGTHGMARVVIAAPKEVIISRLGNVDSTGSPS